MTITAAKLFDGGVLITRNGVVYGMLDGNTGWLRDEYNDWLAVPNTPDPLETLLEAKDRRKTELAGDAQAAIFGGFVSNALGGANNYGSTLADQIEIALKTAASQNDSNSRDVQASGTEQAHSTAQLETLQDELEAHTQAQVVNLLAKQAAVDAVPDTGDLGVDIANVDAVTF